MDDLRQVKRPVSHEQLQAGPVQVPKNPECFGEYGKGKYNGTVICLVRVIQWIQGTFSLQRHLRTACCGISCGGLVDKKQ